MSENIAIIGSGYVGLVTGACFSKFGHRVVFNDINEKMLDDLRRGAVPIHEEGLVELIKHGLARGLISVSTDKTAVVENNDILILCLPTPPKADGNADLRYIREVSKEIGQLMKTPKIIINKSTVPVGTSHLIREIIRHFYPGAFDVVSMPEFLQEGKAVASSLKADRYVVGFEEQTSQAVRERVIALLKPFNSEVVITNNKTAELAKYICNAFLTLEISYINSMAGICEKLGVDITDITRIMRLDTRIGPKAFLEAGPGYGGMCFPKDVWSMIGMADRFGYTHKLLQAVDEINLRQQLNVADKIELFVKTIQHPKISLLGLSFKKNTGDVRQSQAKTVIEELLKRNITTIVAYDPVASENFKTYKLPITYAPSAYEAIAEADCLVMMTDWNEFRALDLRRVKSLMKTPNIVDARNLLDKEAAKKLGFHYLGTGRR